MNLLGTHIFYTYTHYRLTGQNREHSELQQCSIYRIQISWVIDNPLLSLIRIQLLMSTVKRPKPKPFSIEDCFRFAAL